MINFHSISTVKEHIAFSVKMELFDRGHNLKDFTSLLTSLPQNMQHFLSNVVQHSDRAEESSSTVSALQLCRPLRETERFYVRK